MNAEELERENDMRVRFETCARKFYDLSDDDLIRNKDGEYIIEKMEDRWIGWKVLALSSTTPAASEAGKDECAHCYGYGTSLGPEGTTCLHCKGTGNGASGKE